MKKKILLFVAVMAMLICVFAISTSAATPDATKEAVVLSDGTVCPIWDTDGDALIWYVSTANADDGYANYDYVKAQDPRVSYEANGIWDVDGTSYNQISYIKIDGVDGKSNIVVLNINDDDVKVTSDKAKGGLVNGFEFTFDGSTVLEYAYLHTSTVAFQKQAFRNCHKLAYVNFTELENLMQVQSNAFWQCYALFADKTLDLSKTQLRYIGTGAFAGNSVNDSGAMHFTKIIFPSTLKGWLGSYPFQYCSRLTTVEGLETTQLTSLADNMFYHCVKLNSIQLPSTLKSIGSKAFAFINVVNDNTTNLRIAIPAGVTAIGSNAFQNNTSLVSISFTGTSLKAIDNPAFENCKRLGSIAFPEGLETLGNCVLKNCSALQSVTFPTTLKTLNGGDHFLNNTSLTTVIGFENTQLTSLPNNMFSGCSNLTSISLPQILETINNQAFKNCSSLTSVTIPADIALETIGSYVFENNAFTTIRLPDSLTTLGTGAFKNCSSLQEISNFENTGLTVINAETFVGVPLTKLTLPRGLTSIGNSAFKNNRIVQDKLVIPNTVTTIGGWAFAGTQNVTKIGTIVLPANLTSFSDNYVFENDTIGQMYIPAGVEQIRQGVFNRLPSKGVVFYFTGTEAQVEALKAGADKNNEAFTNATIVDLDTYNSAGDKDKKNYIVYGLDPCETFYGGHAETETKPATLPTCTETGLTAEISCSRCSKLIKAQEPVNALGHSYNSVVTEPTCTAGGYTTHTCLVCGDTYKDNETTAVEHKWNGTVCEFNCGVTRVAYIGNVNYATFDAAYEAANAGDTIVLLAPITITNDTTIDKDGITIESAGDVFVVTSGTLTINGNITVKAGTANAGSWCAVWANGGNVIINKGTYSVGGDKEAEDPTHQNDLIYTKANGTVVINGGTFKYTEGVWTLNENDANRGTITVKGGVFEGFNPQNNVSEGPNTNFLPSNFAVVNANGTYTVVNAVAYIGNIGYATFDAAYEAANAKDTIVLLAPITITSDTTIDKDGITIESAGDVFVVESGTLTINGNITVKAGTANVGSWCAVWANGGNVIINNGTYSVGGDKNAANPTHQNDLIYTKANGTVVINGGTFKYTEGVWTLNENDANRGTITVKGGVFEGFNPADNVSEGNNTNFVAPGYVSVVDENGAYNVIKCDHEATVIVEYIYANGFDKDGVEVSECTVCNSKFEKTASKLFTFLGYSIPEDGRGEIVFGYDVNHDAIASYESVTNKTLTYGVFAALDTIGTKDIFAENSGAITNEVAKTSIAFEFKMTGLDTEEYKALKISLGAYVIVDGNVSYMQGGEPAEGDKYEFVSYNLVLNNTK